MSPRGTATSVNFGTRGWARLTVVPTPDDGHVITGAFTLNNELYEITTPTHFNQMKTQVGLRLAAAPAHRGPPAVPDRVPPTIAAPPSVPPWCAPAAGH